MIGCGASSVGVLNILATPKPIAPINAKAINVPTIPKPIPRPALPLALAAEPNLPGFCNNAPPGTFDSSLYNSPKDSGPSIVGISGLLISIGISPTLKDLSLITIEFSITVKGLCSSTVGSVIIFISSSLNSESPD